MRRILILPFLLVLVGCASFGIGTVAPETPRQQYAAAELDFEAVVNSLEQARADGFIDTAMDGRVRTVINTTQAALDGAWAAIQMGDTAAADRWMLSATSGIAALNAELRRAYNERS